MDSTNTRTTKLHRLDENVGNTNVVLTADELEKISTTVNGITLMGARYPEAYEKQIDK